jgi:hypothetical protein
MMPSFSINDLGAFQDWAKMGITNAVMRGCLSTAQRTVQHITTVLIPGEEQPPVFTHAYAAGWHAEKTARGADVVNTIPYGSVIEDGARPENIKIGKAMIEALTQWVFRKGLAGKPRTGARRQEQLVEARNIAWAIALHMKKVGIFNRNGRKGLKIAARAKVKAREFLWEEVRRELKREFA